MAEDPHAWLSAECKPTASDEAKFAEPPAMYRPVGCVTDSELDESSSAESSPWLLHPEIFMVSLSDSDVAGDVAGEERAEPVVEDTEMVDETEVVNLGGEGGVIGTDERGIGDVDESGCNGKRKLPESWKGKGKGKEKDEEADEGTGSGSGKGKEKDEEADEGTGSGSGKGKEKDEVADEGMGSGSEKDKEEENSEEADEGTGSESGKEKEEKNDEGTTSGKVDFVELVRAALAVGRTDDGPEEDENEHWFDMIQRKGYTFPKPRWWP